MKTCDVLILGAGAAGLMCAAEAAARNRQVIVLDHSPKIGRKILVSGGGRCNFTNLNTGPEYYVTSNPGFVRPALSKYTPKKFLALVKAQGIAYHEKKDGQLFCDHTAREIVSLLVTRAEKAGAHVVNGVNTLGVAHSDGRFTLKIESGEAYEAPKLVVATGGLSWPQIGATDLGLRIAKQFGLSIVVPAPGLVGLSFPEREMKRFDGLAGIHLRIGLECGAFKSTDDVMITHKGLSGPVILNASLSWEPGMEITVNWATGHGLEDTYRQLLRDKKDGGRGKVRGWLQERIPRRLADRIAYHAGARGSWTAMSDETLWTLAKDFHAYTFIPSGTFGYSQAEVMRGGVSTHELSPSTMECKKAPGLYFIGEVLDVTGHLGGFNFQWAWASGYAAGKAV